MQLYIDFDKITKVLQEAAKENRFQLYEHETYEILSHLGSESVPEYLLYRRQQRLGADALAPFLGEKVVLKIVSPDVVHKSDVGGVKVVPRLAGKVRSESRRMVDSVSERFASFVETNPEFEHPVFKRLSGESLQETVNRRIQGVLITQYLPPESDALGNELLVSLRWTREFGMVITAGLGGIDTELYAHRFHHGQAVVSATTADVTGKDFFNLFKQTIGYQKLSGQTRGATRLVSDEQLTECFAAFIEVGNYFSPLNPQAPFALEELEVNPFALVDYEMVPLDGLCKFTKPFTARPVRSIEKIGRMLHPRRVAIVGVSGTKINFGRHILNNMIAAGFPRENLLVVSSSADEIDTIPCVADISEVSGVDLLIVAVAAHKVPELAAQVIENRRAESVILIAGGMGETAASKVWAEELVDTISLAHTQKGGGPIFLGGNCMGVISRPGQVDSFFALETITCKRRESPPAPVALVSQSGAFARVRLAELVVGDPTYNITVGNQIDITIGDCIGWLAQAAEIGVIAVYVEGFKDLDGLAAERSIRQAVKNGKEVIIYKAGRTPEGKKATSGHTASVAGDYMVCTSCLTQAGALVTDSLEEFDGLMNLASVLHTKRVTGCRVAGLSPAGYESVGIADSLQSRDSSLQLPNLSPATTELISDYLSRAGLTEITEVKNPLDLTPAATDELILAIIKALLEDDNIDAVVSSLGSLAPATLDTPAPDSPKGYITAENSISSLLPKIFAKSSKPIILFNDAGELHRPISERLKRKGVPVFDTCNQAMTLLARYTSYRQRLQQLHTRKTTTTLPVVSSAQ